VLGYDEHELDLLICRIKCAYGSVGLKVNVKKSISPTLEPVKVIGITMCGRQQRIFVDSHELSSLVYRTVQLIGVGECTSHEMSIIIGHWCWYMLIKRPLFSILKTVYRFIEIFKYDGRIKQIWSTVKRELLLICCLCPLIQMDLNVCVLNRVVCTDASMSGFGVMSNRNVDTIELQACLNQLSALSWYNSSCSSISFEGLNPINKLLDEISLPITCHQPIIMLTKLNRSSCDVEISNLVRILQSNVQWIEIMKGRWKYNNESTHINELEMSCVLLAIRWLCSLICIRGRGKTIIMLVDNSVTICSIRKGRSSSIPLLKLLRRICCLVLCMNFQLKLFYIPSQLNPADAASRSCQRNQLNL
jgi:hypothetical protein